MAPSTDTLYSEAIDRRADDSADVAACAAAALTYIEFVWPKDGVYDLHVAAAVFFLERLSNGDTMCMGATVDDLAVLRTAIAAGVLEDIVPLHERRIVSDVLAQAMKYMREQADA